MVDFAFSLQDVFQKTLVNDNIFFISQGTRALIMALEQFNNDQDSNKLSSNKKKLLQTISNNIQTFGKILKKETLLDVDQSSMDTEASKLFASSMNIVQKAREKYFSSGSIISNIEQIILRELAGHIEHLKSLSKSFLTYPPQENAIITTIMNFSKSNSILISNLNEVISNNPPTKEQLQLCMASLDRAFLQMEITACMYCLHHRQNEVKDNTLALICRSWSCFIPLTLYYLHKSIHPDKKCYI